MLGVQLSSFSLSLIGMGANCSLKWRVADEKERLWNLEPGHPVAVEIGDLDFVIQCLVFICLICNNLIIHETIVKQKH